MTEPTNRPIEHILLGAAIVATAAGFAVVLPPALTGVALVLILLRICWLEDNIKSDLMGTKALPANHEQTLRERAALLGTDPDIRTAAMMATALRGQIQALWAAVFGGLSTLIAAQLVWHPPLALSVGVFMVWLGFRRADRLLVTLSYLERGHPLPKDVLASAHPWVHSHRVRDE
ncbi:MAG: hypothetical protein AAGF30_02205 [Pseudomonadota bacterium]